MVDLEIDSTWANHGRGRLISRQAKDLGTNEIRRTEWRPTYRSSPQDSLQSVATVQCLPSGAEPGQHGATTPRATLPVVATR